VKGRVSHLVTHEPTAAIDTFILTGGNKAIIIVFLSTVSFFYYNFPIVDKKKAAICILLFVYNFQKLVQLRNN